MKTDRAERLEAGSLQALVESARLLVSSLELDELLRSLLRSVMGRLVVSRGLLTLVDDSGEETVAISRGFRKIPTGTPFDPKAHSDALPEAGIAHLLPIGPEDAPVGHLALGRPLTGDPGPRELELLEALLGIAAAAIENARAHQKTHSLNLQLDRRVQQLATLLDLVRSLTSTFDATHVAQLLGLTLAGQWLLRRYAVVAVKEGHLPVLRQKGMALPEPLSLVADLGSADTPMAVADLPQGPLREALEASQAQVLVPLLAADRTLGFAALGAPAGGRSFESEDLEFCAGLAAQAVVAFENAWYFAEAVEKQKLERDLALAGEIQQRLFPARMPDLPGFQAAARNRPASQVGGDYYDALPVASNDDELWLLCVADVSGKGVAASLLMSNIQATLRALLAECSDPADLVQRTSRLVFATTPANKYATAIFVLLEPASGGCRCVNAGHNEGLLIRADGTIEELNASGLPVGLMGVGGYRAEDFQMEPGDVLALYSDGVNEANDADENELGMEAFKESLLGHRHGSAEEICEGVFADVDAFAAGAPQYDDITLMILKRSEET